MRDYEEEHGWVTRARAAGWAEPLGIALDVLAPLGPLAAQLLWAAQPALGVVVERELVAGLARALERPGGADALRALLVDPPAGTPARPE